MVWRGIKEAVKAVALILFVLLIAGTGRPTEAQTSTDQTAARLLERIEKLEQSLAAVDVASNSSGILKKEQNTATLGLVWWLGRKTGTW